MPAAPARVSERATRLLAVAVATISLVCLAGIGATAALDLVFGDDLSCPVPGQDSVYGDARFDWWQLSRTCDYSVAGFPYVERRGAARLPLLLLSATALPLAVTQLARDRARGRSVADALIRR